MGVWGKLVYPVMKSLRVRRIKQLTTIYPDLAEMSVLDVGGRPIIWDLLSKEMGIKPKKLIILNTEEETENFDNYERVIGDGTKLLYSDKSFDLVFSNSVIEHVGSEESQIAFAKESLRVGKNIYIQTPNRWFPVETHIITLFIHWLPWKWFGKLSFISLRFIFLISDIQRFDNIISGIRLLNRQQLQTFFPERKILVERFCGIAKSFIVI